MPFALIFVGLLLMIAGVRNTEKKLFNLLLGDFTGPNNFMYWALAVTAVGSVGYIDAFKQFATAFLGLLLAVLLLGKDKNGAAFFEKFTEAFKNISSQKAQIDETPFGSAASFKLDIPKGILDPLPKSVSGISTKSATGTTNPLDAQSILHEAWDNRDLIAALSGGF